jgi:hypothetical protein
VEAIDHAKHQRLLLQFFKCSWGWTQIASETCRVLLQLLINILPSCIMLVLYIYYFWCFRTTVCPKFKDQGVQAWPSDLGLHISTDLTSWSVKYKICTYNYLFVFLALQPFWLYFLLPRSGLYPPHYWGFFILHNDAPQSVGLLWTNNQAVAETSFWQNTKLTTNTHAPIGIGTHNLSGRAAADLRLRLRGYWDRNIRIIMSYFYRPDNWAKSHNRPWYMSSYLCLVS